MPIDALWSRFTESAVFTVPGWHALFILCVGLLLAVAVDRVGRRMMRRMAALTVSTLDDAILEALGHLPGVSMGLAAAWYALLSLHTSDFLRAALGGLIASAAVAFWSVGALRLGKVLLDHVAERRHDSGLLQTRTLPLFDILMKVIVASLAIYFLLLAWKIDVSAWVASAGIVGIAVGFAAKDTLSNLLAGLSILADAPYKIGDCLVLDGGTRGRVTAIGLRSTRLLTRDDIEVILPNAVMASVRIINESGGPHEKERVRCPVLVSYDSDLDHVTRVLLEVAAESELLVHNEPPLAPRVRCRSFDDSGIAVELLGWIRLPEQRGMAVDELIRLIHRRFREEKIVIPFPQRDLHMGKDGG